MKQQDSREQYFSLTGINLVAVLMDVFPKGVQGPMDHTSLSRVKIFFPKQTFAEVDDQTMKNILLEIRGCVCAVFDSFAEQASQRKVLASQVELFEAFSEKIAMMTTRGQFRIGMLLPRVGTPWYGFPFKRRVFGITQRVEGMIDLASSVAGLKEEAARTAEVETIKAVAEVGFMPAITPYHPVTCKWAGAYPSSN